MSKLPAAGEGVSVMPGRARQRVSAHFLAYQLRGYMDPREAEEHRRKMLKAGERYRDAKLRLRAALVLMVALIDEGILWGALSSTDADNGHWNRVWRRAVKNLSEANQEAVKSGYAFQDRKDRLEGRKPRGSPPLD